MGPGGICKRRSFQATVLSGATTRSSCTHKMSRHCASATGTKAPGGLVAGIGDQLRHDDRPAERIRRCERSAPIIDRRKLGTPVGFEPT
jgi:hypothetical protein